MVETQELDVLKDIPGYKAILKALIKSQIQHLVEQLSSHTDEECVLLSASLSDGSLSHLGSNFGKQFLESHDDVKKQFLGFCFEKQLTTPASTSESPPSYDDQGSTAENKPKRQRFGKASAAARQAALPYMDYRINKHANNKQIHEAGANITPTRSRAGKSLSHSSALGSTSGYGGINQNVAETKNFSSDSYKTEAGVEFDAVAGEISKSSGSQLDQFVNNEMQTGTSVLGNNENQGLSTDGGVVVKVEPSSNEGSDLEITGVNLGQLDDANYGYGNQSSAGDTSFDKELWSTNTQEKLYGYPVDPSMLSNFDAIQYTSSQDDAIQTTYSQGHDLPSQYERPESDQKEKRFTCCLCERRFVRKDYLNKHMLLHTGEKPHKCMKCPAAFRQRSHLRMHLMKHTLREFKEEALL